MTPLTARLLELGKEASAASQSGEPSPCVECRSVHYDDDRAVWVMVGNQLMGRYCAPCFRVHFLGGAS